MFERSYSWKRVAGEPPKALRMHLGYVPELDTEDGESKRNLRLAVGLAVAFHLVLFVVHFPSRIKALEDRSQPAKVFVVQQIRFKAPPPKAAQQIPKQKEKKRIIPIPDPTPEEPEPIVVEEVEMPEIDALIGDVVFGIPEGPPAAYGVGGEGPIRLGGDVVPPEKIFYPSPRYTEEGRQARITGVVILEAVIDTVGNVANVKVLKGLPMGLTESAVETAKQWKFRPATRGGEPVAVFLNLTIRFSLQ
jgi:TonB family protein